MSADANTRQVFARYSLRKTLLWALIVGVVAGGILVEGFNNGWRAPPGSVHGGAYLMGYGAAPFCLVIAMAMTANLVMSRGVAMAKVGDQIVLYFPFGRKRISLSDHLTVLATIYKADARTYYRGPFRPPSVEAPQVTFARSGQPDVNFRTGLLTERADVIAPRIAEAIKARQA